MEYISLATPLPNRRDDPRVRALNIARNALHLALGDSDGSATPSDDYSAIGNVGSDRSGRSSDPATGNTAVDRSDLDSRDDDDQGSATSSHPGTMTCIPQHRPKGLFDLCLTGLLISLAFVCYWYGRQRNRTTPDVSHCLLTPHGEHIIPQAIRAPLNAMGADLAMSPDYAEQWLWSGMPFDVPHLPGPDNRHVRKAVIKLREARNQELIPPTRMLPDWWTRLNKPAQEAGPIYQRMERARAVRRSGNVTQYLTNFGTQAYCQWRPEDRICTPYLDSQKTDRAGALVKGLFMVVHDACDPDSVNNAPAFQSMNATRNALVHLQTTIFHRVNQIIEQEATRVKTDPRAMRYRTPMVFSPPDRRASWSADDETETRTSQAYFLSPPTEVLGIRIPSESVERELNALAAVYAQVLWMEMSMAAFDSLQVSLRQMCSSAVRHTDSLDKALEMVLLRLTSEKEATRATVQLAMGQNMLIDPEENKPYPLFEYDGIRHSEAAKLGLNVGRSKPSVGDTLPSDSDSARDVPRTPIEKTWKSVVLGSVRLWGTSRTLSDGSSRNIHQHLSDCIQGDKKPSPRIQGEWLHDQATLAIYSFWLRGASPAWYTFQKPHPHSINPEPYVSDRTRSPSRILSGKMYNYLDRDRNAGVHSEVNLELVSGWGKL